MNQIMTDVDLAALYNSVVAGITEIDQLAKEPRGTQARILSSRLGEFLSERTSPPGAEQKTNPVGFPPDMTTDDIGGEIGLRILMNFAHRGLAPGACEGADAIGRRILATVNRAIDNGADDQVGMIADFKAAQAAAGELLKRYRISRRISGRMDCRPWPRGITTIAKF
jgi:hypothetical protein